MYSEFTQFKFVIEIEQLNIVNLECQQFKYLWQSLCYHIPMNGLNLFRSHTFIGDFAYMMLPLIRNKDFLPWMISRI